MHDKSLSFYALLAARRPRSFRGKVFLVAFLGTHVPLLALFAWFLVKAELVERQSLTALAVALAATLVGTAATLIGLDHLLRPLRLTSRGLQRYLATGEVPDLPDRYRDEAGTLMADVGLTLRRLDATVHQLEQYDALTGLLNRRGLEAAMPEALSDLPPEGEGSAALLLLDLDGFSQLNSALGAEAGDEVLRGVGARLDRLARPDDRLARLEADRFAVLRRHPGRPGDVEAWARALLAEIERPLAAGGAPVIVTASAGIGLAPEDADRGAELLATAEGALQEAIRTEAPGPVFSSADVLARLRRRVQLETEVRLAVEREELHLVYQPLVELATQRPVAVEALLRWSRDGHTPATPGEFVPVLQSTGLIAQVGEWVLRTASHELEAWTRRGAPPVRLAVNLSPLQFRSPRLAADVERVLAETGLPPERLELELTESLAMEDTVHSQATFARLKRLGVAIAIDDFGTGHSSLASLRRFRIDTLKIDRSFVAGLDDEEGAAIVRAILALARSLDLEVVAEGIETTRQAELLREHGCRLGQGFLFSRPLAGPELASRLWEV